MLMCRTKKCPKIHSNCLWRLSLHTFYVREFGRNRLLGSRSFFAAVVCPFCQPDLRNKVTGGVIAGGAPGCGRIMPMLPRISPYLADQTGQLAASLCPVNDQAATLTGELPIHNIQPPPPNDIVIPRPRNLPHGSGKREWSDLEIRGWPGRVSLAWSASTGQSPFGGAGGRGLCPK